MHRHPDAVLEDLYRAFARLAPELIEGCPCCTTPEEFQQLLAKPLRQLTGDDLNRYAHKAITTMGSGDDLRYFWPRLVELALTEELITDREVVFHKPRLAEWRTRWSAAEQRATTEFAQATVAFLIEREADPDDLDSWVCAFGRCFEDVTEVLDPFLRPTRHARQSLRSWYDRNEPTLAEGELQNAFWSDEPNARQLVAWFARPDVVAALAGIPEVE